MILLSHSIGFAITLIKMFLMALALPIGILDNTKVNR